MSEHRLSWTQLAKLIGVTSPEAYSDAIYENLLNVDTSFLREDNPDMTEEEYEEKVNAWVEVISRTMPICVCMRAS